MLIRVAIYNWHPVIFFFLANFYLFCILLSLLKTKLQRSLLFSVEIELRRMKVKTSIWALLIFHRGTFFYANYDSKFWGTIQDYEFYVIPGVDITVLLFSI